MAGFILRYSKADGLFASCIDQIVLKLNVGKYKGNEIYSKYIIWLFIILFTKKK